jgi:hypothetical protein
MLWFLRGLRRGVVTTRYPAEIDAWTLTLRTPPAFRSQLLTRELADRLVDGCDTRALRRDGNELVLDLGACTACGQCAKLGGEAVVSSGALLLATTDRDALSKRVPIRGGERGA